MFPNQSYIRAIACASVLGFLIFYTVGDGPVRARAGSPTPVFQRVASGSWRMGATNYTASVSARGISIPIAREPFRIALANAQSGQGHDAAESATVSFREVLPGVDLRYGQAAGNVEFDFLIAPQTNSSQIQMTFSGAKGLNVGSDGALTMVAAGAEVELPRPLAWQEENGTRTYIAANYRLEDDGCVGFALGAYDRDRTLVIDPVVLVRVPLEGLPAAGEPTNAGRIAIGSQPSAQDMAAGRSAFAMAYAADGSLYLGGNNHAWITKYTASGDAEKYRTYLGMDVRDTVTAMAVDASGALHVAGSVWQQGREHGFSAALTPDGALAYMNTVPHAVHALALGHEGQVYLAGDGFVLRENGWRLNFPAAARALAVDSQGHLFVAGRDASQAFVARVAANGTGLDWTRSLGSGSQSVARALAVGADDALYVAGATNAHDLPVKVAFQAQLAGATDAFAARLTTSGAIQWATYFGGNGLTAANGAVVDGSGAFVIAGTTDVPDLPLAGPGQNGESGFVATFDAAGKLRGSGYVEAAGAARLYTAANAPDGRASAAGAVTRGTQDVLFARVGRSNTAVGSTRGGKSATLGAAAPAFLLARGAAPISIKAGSGSADPPPAFAPSNTSPFNVGTSPIAIGIADFNGDTNPDMAVANYVSNDVSILLGDGRGGFTAGTTVAAGSQPVAVATGDFNGDGKFDLAVTNNASNNVTVLLGNGDGTFRAAPGSPVSVSQQPQGIAIGDFNKDGRKDLAVVNFATEDVTILLGGGDGSFALAPGSPFVGGPNPSYVVTDDFNGDGNLDLAVTNSGSNKVSVFLGNGTGGFTAASGSPFPVGLQPAFVVSGDLNGDGKIDLAVSNFGTNTVSVLLGAGNGSFAAGPGSPFTVGASPAELVMADFNGDGKRDLAVANKTANSITVLPGDGTGGFSAASTYVVGSQPLGVAIGDFNKDGRVDLAIANSATNNVTVLVAEEALGLFPINPCRVVDTRTGSGRPTGFGPPSLTSGVSRNFAIASTNCPVGQTAQAYALNATVVPQGSLGYLSLWRAGQPFPIVSTLNSINGSVIANAAIVPAGTNGAITAMSNGNTDVILDANGYFAPPTGSELLFYPVAPCRVVDTRQNSGKTGPFGAPALGASSTRNFPLTAGACNIPSTAQAYAVNFTVVPQGPLGYLTAWPAGQNKPLASILNSPNGSVIANAAIVPAGTGGNISVFVTNATDLVIDISGYFATASSSGLHFYPLPPCRVADTRQGSGKTGAFGPPSLGGGQQRDFPISASACGAPSSAQAYSLNVTAVPQGFLGYISVWKAGQPYPTVSTLNSYNGSVIANAAIVPAGTNGAVSVLASNPTDVVIDINGYFAP